MPRVSVFYGIVIAMYYNDHAPPHFHAAYGEHEALLEIGSHRVVAGSVPSRALRLVLDWAELHDDELAGDWELARLQEPLSTIEPLLWQKDRSWCE